MKLTRDERKALQFALHTMRRANRLADGRCTELCGWLDKCEGTGDQQPEVQSEANQARD